jgi:hypothetical protein
LIAIGAAMLIALSGPPAEAGYVVTLTQQGSNVVANGSGPIDLSGLSLLGPGSATADMTPIAGIIYTGPTSLMTPDVYSGIIHGPSAFGLGGPVPASSGSGDLVGISMAFSSQLSVPTGYLSGNPLSDSAVYDNQTFSSLRVTPGTYEWNWGSGANQNFTLDIEAVPAPLIGRGLPVLLAVGGLLFGAKLLERRKKHRLQFG